MNQWLGREGGFDWNGAMRTSWDGRNVSHPDYGGGYTRVRTCQNWSNQADKVSASTVCKLHLNEGDLREKKKDSRVFIPATKNIKYLGINLKKKF